jgi:hypothetical protein
MRVQQSQPEHQERQSSNMEEMGPEYFDDSTDDEFQAGDEEEEEEDDDDEVDSEQVAGAAMANRKPSQARVTSLRGNNVERRAALQMAMAVPRKPESIPTGRVNEYSKPAVLFEISMAHEGHVDYLSDYIKLPHKIINASAWSAAWRKRHFWGQKLPSTEPEGPHPTIADFLNDHRWDTRHWPEWDTRLLSIVPGTSPNERVKIYRQRKFGTITTSSSGDLLKALNKFLVDHGGKFKDDLDWGRDNRSNQVGRDGNRKEGVASKLCTFDQQRKAMRGSNFLWKNRILQQLTM